MCSKCYGLLLVWEMRAVLAGGQLLPVSLGIHAAPGVSDS